MRNLSMKKFGTPMGAAPGMATERAGLEMVGVPSAATGAAGLSSALRWARAARSRCEPGALSSYGRG